MWRLFTRQMDGAFVSTALLRMSSSLTGLVSAWAIIVYLTPEQQGYWYTFMSLLAIAAFAELGAGQILLRFVAHEVGHREGELTPQGLLRLRALFAFSLKWGGAVSLVSALIAYPLGVCWFGFRAADTGVGGGGPWALAAVACIPMLLLGFLNAFFEGWQRVTVTNASRLCAAWVTLGATLAAFVSGLGLWAFGIGRLAGSGGGMVVTALLQKSLIREHSLLSPAPGAFAWKTEFLPLQTRYALTWVTGILVNSFYAPVIFRMVGAEAAGKFGMTISVVAILGAIASALVGARQARMAALAGKGDVAGLAAMFRPVLLLSIMAYGAGSAALALVLWLQPGVLDRYVGRLLPPADMALATVAGFFWLLITLFTTCVRSFNQEPFVRLAWCHAIGSVLAILPAVHYWETTGALVVSAVGNAASSYFCWRYAARSLGRR